MAARTIQADGLTLFHIRYWHPIFVAWRVANRSVVVRYHPEDLSRIFVSKDGKDHLEALSFKPNRRMCVVRLFRYGSSGLFVGS